MATAFITHPECVKHDMGPGHPECPERLAAIEDQLIASGTAPWLQRYEAPAASQEQLERAHSPGYIDSIRAAAPARGLVQIDPDTAMNPHTLSAALHAAGAAVLGVDLVMRGEADSAFAAVRPPGHHACRARAMGFCIFNNVAVGALHALEAHGLERVAVIDFDVHHGNGTEDIFSGDERVLMVSTFQHPFYPFSGAGPAASNMVNIPLPAGSGSSAFRQAVDTHWLPALEAFAPQCVFFSAGFDAHREDDMAMMGLVDDDYGWVTRAVKAATDRASGARVVSVLEGGYSLHALGRSAVQHVRALASL
jgi:acetoin utilization deacetylase AcuC-like enzyme